MGRVILDLFMWGKLSCNIGKLVLLYGSSCFGPSFYCGELSWDELSRSELF